MKVKRLSMPEDYEFTDLFGFYQKAAELVGIETSEETSFNPRAIQISQGLFDKYMPAYVKEVERMAEGAKDDPDASHFLEAIASSGLEHVANIIWLQYGPSVRDTLEGFDMIVLEGFVLDADPNWPTL